MSQMSEGLLPGSICPFCGQMGGEGLKHPIDTRTGLPDMGYALCDGGEYATPAGAQVTTPDLRGRFILGANDEFTKSSIGGSTNHHHDFSVDARTLTSADLPDHTHFVQTYRSDEPQARGTRIPATRDDRTSEWAETLGVARITSTSLNQAHTHTAKGAESVSLPPYYSLCYIMKL